MKSGTESKASIVSDQVGAENLNRTDPSDPVLDKIIGLAQGELTELLDQSNIGLWLWDVAADSLELSQGMVRLTGFGSLDGVTRQEVLSGLLHPEDLEQTADATRRLFEHGESYETICRMRHVSGRYSWALTKGAVVHREDGQPSHMIGVVKVLDDLERVKSDLFRSEQVARLGNWYMDLRTEKLTWSRGVYNLLGLEPFSIEPNIEFARSLCAEEDRKMIERTIDEALSEKIPYEYYTRIVREGHRDIHIRVRGAVEIGITGDATAYYGTIQDITDEVERDEQIRRAQKLESIGKLTGGVAHDFNNLLAVILGNLELLQEENVDLRGNELVDAAIQATLRGSELTRNMLSFARRAQLAPTRQDLNQVVRTTKNWIARTLPETIEIETSLLAGLWRADVDPNSLENALLNLILNARDAMPDGGRLTIETENMRIDDEYIQSRYEDIEPGRYVMLAVSDTGHGIPQGAMDNVFEPFFTTKGVGEGSGMGLPMVQGFVKQSGGTIQVYSEPGVGTTFKLYFKASDDVEKPRALRARHDPTERKEKNGNSILLVEDEAEVLSVLKAILNSAGFSVTTAVSGDEAKQVFLNDPKFDLLMTDIVMPGALKGTDLAQELRDIRQDLPVIFLSGYAKEAAVHGNGLCANDFRLMKPVSKRDLLRTVDEALSLPN